MAGPSAASSASSAGEPRPTPKGMPTLGVTPEDRLGSTPAGLGLAIGKPQAFALDDVAGGKKTLGEIARGAPLLVVFYRGGSCPYCNLQLHELAKAKAELAARGVEVVAISVDTPKEEAKTRAKNDASFAFLSDPDLVAHRAFAVVHAARGVVRFAHVDEEYKTRPSAAQLLAVIDRTLPKR